MTRWFVRLLLATFLFQTASYAIRPMVSYRALELGAGGLEIGIIVSAHSALPLLAAVPIGRWVDRWGETPFISGGAGLIAMSSLLMLWVNDLWVLGLAQAPLGLGHIMILLACQTLIANSTVSRRRDASYGMFTVVVSIGQLVGPAAAGLLAGAALAGSASESSQTGMAGVVFWSAGAVAALACLLGLTLPRRPRDRAGIEPDRPRMSSAALRVLRLPGMPRAMLASLTVLTTVDLLIAYLPVYAEARGWSVQVVGFLLATRAGATMASRLLMVPLLNLLDRRRLLVLSMAVPAVCLCLFPLVSPIAAVFAAMVVIGFGLGLGQPITMSWVAGTAPPDIRGTAIGVRLMGNRFGQMVLPLAVGGIVGATGVVAIFITVGSLLALSSSFVLTAPLNSEDG